MKKRLPTGRVLDMTQGKPLGLILRFAVPLFIGNIFQQLYSMADTMVVGHHLGDQALAAIGATASLFSLIINFAGGLNNGYGIVVTQRFGSHDTRQMKQAIAGMLVLNAAAALVLTTLALICLRPLMSFMNTPAAVFDQAYRYMVIIFAGMAATMGYNLFAAILRAFGNSRSPLYFLILSSLLNILLDVLFVMVFSMGIGGAALATVLAQTVSAVLCGGYVWKYYREYLPEPSDFRVPKSILRNLYTMGFSMALMSSLVDLGSVFFIRANNVLGEAMITAYAAGRKLLIIMIQPQATIAVACSTFIAQNWGARKPDRIRTALRQSLLLELGWSFFASTVIFLFGAGLIRLTTGTEDPRIISSAVLSLRIHFAMFPVLGMLFCIRNALQAMGQKLAPVLSSGIELGMKILSANLFIPHLGFLGTCITEPITWGLMVIFLSTVYLSRRKALFASLSSEK